MNASSDTFWKNFDKAMEGMNTAYIRMCLATTPTSFDTQFAEYIKALQNVTKRCVTIYDSVYADITDRKDTDNDEA